jgi:hypothetical protein
MIRTFYLPFRLLLLPLALSVFAPLLRAQESDVLISSEPTQGARFDQHWSGVFERKGKVFAVWGEQRLDTVTGSAPSWYSSGIWSKRGSPSVDVTSSFFPDSLLADDGRPSRPLYQTATGNITTAVFDGLWVVGVTRVRGDINLPPDRTDTLYKARFMVYFADGRRWPSGVVHEIRRTGVPVAVQMRQFNYNPNTGEVLAAWNVFLEQTGSVTSIDTSGTVLWTATSIPFPAPPARYNLVPLKNKEFLLIIDSMGVRYDNGLARESIKFPMHDGLRYQRITGDRFIRSYVSSDTTKYVLEIYDMTGTLTKTVQLPWGYAPTSYFITENRRPAVEDDATFAVISAGTSGVHAQLLRDDFTPLKPLEKISTGVDSTAYAPAGTFLNDTLFVVWQDSRNGDADVYGRAFNYRPHTIVDTTEGVEDVARGQIGVGSIAPNPASRFVAVDVTLPIAASVDIEMVDLTGRMVKKQSGQILSEGRHVINLDVQDLATGTYSLVIRAGRLNAGRKLVIVR